MNKKKVISLLLAVCTAGILSTGTTLALETIPALAKPKIIATVTKPEQNQELFEVLLSNGIRILTNKDDILNQIYNQDNICVNGIFYSKSERALMYVVAEYNQSEKEHIILTTYQYINNLNEILNEKVGYERHSAKYVEAKPMTELYNLLDIEQPEITKLTK